MGVDNYIYFVFDGKPEEIKDFLKKEFEVEVRDEEFGDPRMDYLREKGLLGEDFQLITSGELLFDPPLRTMEWGAIINADFWIYTVNGYTILEIHPVLRSRWGFVLSSEVIRLLKQFMKEEPLLICGYRDDVELTGLGFEHNMSYLFINWLPEAIKTGKLETLPSALTVVKKEFMTLGEGLYEVPIPWRPGERGFLFVGGLDGYAVIWFFGIVDFDDPEDVKESLMEPWEMAWDLVIPVKLPLENAKRVQSNRWQEMVREIFNAHISEDYSRLKCMGD